MTIHGWMGRWLNQLVVIASNDKALTDYDGIQLVPCHPGCVQRHFPGVNLHFTVRNTGR